MSGDLLKDSAKLLAPYMAKKCFLCNLDIVVFVDDNSDMPYSSFYNLRNFLNQLRNSIKRDKRNCKNVWNMIF